MSKSWDKSILRKLKTLMGRGLSAAEIGKRMGLSKNAIVGKMHRMGWNPKAVEDGKAASAVKAKSSGAKAVSKKPAAKKPGTVARKSVAKKTVGKKAELKKVAKKSEPKEVAVDKTPATKKAVDKTPAVAKAKTVAPKKTESVVSAKKPEVKSEQKPVAVGRPIAGHGKGAHQRIVQHALEMANLKQNQCRWPIGDPDSDDFHFCGKPVFVGKPYCYDHCKMAYQFTPPKKK